MSEKSMRRKKYLDIPIVGINIAPVINLALVLVIVWIITAPILNIPNIPVNLPKAVTIEAKERNVTVSLSKDGRVAINTEVVEYKNLVPILRKILKRDKNLLVIVRADKDIHHGEVEKVYDLLVGRVGAKRIAVATEQRRE